MHKINNALIFCLFISSILVQRTLNCLGSAEIHALCSCTLINLIQQADEVSTDRAKHSPLSSVTRLTELSHQLSFPH